MGIRQIDEVPDRRRDGPHPFPHETAALPGLETKASGFQCETVAAGSVDSAGGDQESE